MRTHTTYYYLLFVLLIMGAFASMAQNDYGVAIVGVVAALFGLLFIIQLLFRLRQKNKKGIIDSLELISLAALSVILAMRVFYLRFQFIEMVFGLAGLILIAVYIQKLMQSWQSLKDKGRTLAILIVLFHSSIVLYVTSMVTVPFLPGMAEPSGGLAFALLISFVVISVVKKDIMVAGEKVSGLKYVATFKDRSVLLLALFVLFTAYMGLTKVGVLPKMYSDEFPQAYFELVNQAETGKEKPVNGKFKHEEFKEKYDRFVERNGSAAKK